MNTKILEYIIAIAETKSLTQAADRFYLSRPALSKHLKKIEERMGSPLFYRDNKKLELTPAGVIYINNATAILQTEKELMENLKKLKAEESGRIIISVDFAHVNFFYRRILPRFREKYPDAYLELRTSNAEEAIPSLREGSAQFGIFFSRKDSIPGLMLFPLEEDELCMIFPKDSAAAKHFRAGDYTHPALQETLLAVHPKSQTTSIFEKECLSMLKLTPKTVVETQLFTDAIKWVEAGTAMTFVPAVRLKREEGTPFEICHMTPPFTINTILAVSQTRVMNKVEQELMGIIIEEYSHFEDYILHETLWEPMVKKPE